MTGILDRIRETTVQDLEGVSASFDDLPRPVYVSRKPKNMVRTVEGADDLKMSRPAPKAPGMVKTSDWSGNDAPATHEARCLECGDFHPNSASCAPTPKDIRSEGQVRYMDNLISWITEKDAVIGEAARKWTDNVTASGQWSYDKTHKFSISKWIDSLKAKNAELNAIVKNEPRTTTGPVLTGNVEHDALIIRENRSGKPMPQYYAIVEDGITKFFRVKAGTKPGWWWIDAQASDDFHPIKNVARKNEILRAIVAAGPEASMRLYGQQLGSCGRCHRTLTDETSRANGIGPECEGKL